MLDDLHFVCSFHFRYSSSSPNKSSATEQHPRSKFCRATFSGVCGMSCTIPSLNSCFLARRSARSSVHPSAENRDSALSGALKRTGHRRDWLGLLSLRRAIWLRPSRFRQFYFNVRNVLHWIVGHLKAFEDLLHQHCARLDNT